MEAISKLINLVEFKLEGFDPSIHVTVEWYYREWYWNYLENIEKLLNKAMENGEDINLVITHLKAKIMACQAKKTAYQEAIKKYKEEEDKHIKVLETFKQSVIQSIKRTGKKTKSGYRKSSGSNVYSVVGYPSVSVVDINKLDVEFIRTKEEPNKKKILAEYKKDGVIPAGCYIDKKNSLRITVADTQ